MICFFEFARLVNELQPKVFSAENVAGLVKGRSKGYFKFIMRRLRECGYNVEARLLDAQWLGVPQRRRRVFMIGVRKDFDVSACFPLPLSYCYTLRDAIFDLQLNDEHHYLKRHPNVSVDLHKKWHILSNGQSDRDNFTLIRCHWNRPCPTLTTFAGSSGASSMHPDVPRKFSIPELVRISSFPDDYVIKGTISQQSERLGRCVPPVMMAHVARTIRTQILDQL